MNKLYARGHLPLYVLWVFTIGVVTVAFVAPVTHPSPPRTPAMDGVADVRVAGAILPPIAPGLRVPHKLVNELLQPNAYAL